MTRMDLISVMGEEDGRETSLEGELPMQWNIFMALSVFVDQRRITPSRDPEAKKFAAGRRRREGREEEEERRGGGGGKEGRRRRRSGGEEEKGRRGEGGEERKEKER